MSRLDEIKARKRERRRRKRIAIFSTIGGIFAVWAGVTIALAAQPMSEYYSMDIGDTEYRLHIGDAVSIPYTFSEIKGFAYTRFLQGLKERTIKFTTTDENIASVDEDGNITATGKGSAVITVTVADIEQEIRVDSYVPATEVTFGEKEYSLNYGETLQLETVIEPADAVLFDDLTYESSDEKILKITDKGRIVTEYPGDATITVSADGFTGKAKVHVLQPMTGIEIADTSEEEEVVVERGTTHQFEINYIPANTTDDRTVTYTLSDPEIGTIDEDGLFTAKTGGHATLTATCGEFTSTVQVYSKVTLEGIEINHETCDLSYPAQDTLTYTLIPADATDQLNVTWTSANTGVVAVDANGVVTAAGGGTTTVTVNVNGYEKSCTYNVVVPITSVAISSGGLALYTGTSSRLTASVVPSFTTEPDTSITWTSDNPGVATVDASGLVYAAAAGTTVIRATHGQFQAACTVSVTDKPTWAQVADNIIAYGSQYVGRTPYVYGGNSMTSGIDCSGFTQQCFATQGISLARTSYTQVNQGSAVSLDPSAWRRGDLIFYSKNGSVYHVAIYIGNGQILQSAESQGGVCITAYNYNGMTPSHVRRYF